MSSNLKIKVQEVSQKDPEWDKYLHDVKVFIGKHYIKNIMEWVRKRGNTIKDEEGNQFINMVASCYDEDMRVAKAAKLLSDWVTTNDHQHTEWDEDPKSPLERQIMLFDSPAESKKNEDASDELQGIDIPKGSILEDVVDWAEYTADEDGTIKDVLEELLDKGVMSGMTFLISYEDGQNFFNEHKDEINKLLGNYIYSEDGGPFTTDGWDSEDPLALTPNNQFCLAAFAFEEVARDLLDKIS